MRIALINMQGKKRGGLEKFSQKIRLFLEEKGWTVSCLQGESFELPKTRLRKKKAFGRACSRLVSKHPFDAVFSLEKHDCPSTHLRLGEGLHKEYLETRYAAEPRWKKWQLQSSRFHKSALATEKGAIEDPNLQVLFCNSHMVKKQVLSHYRIAPEKIRVVHNSIDWDSYSEYFSTWPEKKALCLQRHALPDCFHFLFVGHGFTRKGLLYLLKAFSHLREEAHLSIVGSCKTQKALERYAEKQGLKHRVRFFGTKPPNEFYAMADCLVVPSLYDPFPNVLLEAKAMGLTALTSPHTGAAEILSPSSIIPDLTDLDAFIYALEQAVKHRKTAKSAKKEREWAKSYDDREKLTEIVDSIDPL